MLFFKKIPVIADNSETIYHPHDPEISYPLYHSNPELMRTDLEIIRNKLKKWLKSDIDHARNTHNVASALLRQIVKLDIKYLGYPEHIKILQSSMRDTSLSKSGTRLLDCFIRINMSIDQETIYVITGKFLYSVIYGCGTAEYNQMLPNKEQWFSAILEYPWIPYLVYLQEQIDEYEELVID